jgi:1,2-diacylglycerol 3-alpha-glucosyltransferase
MPTNVLLYSSGLGYIQRGLETFTQELYESLQHQPDVRATLFQGQGNLVDGAIPVWSIKRNSPIYDLEIFKPLKPKSYRIENLIFSLPIALHCYSKPCNIIHFSEGLPANILYHLRKKVGGSFKLLFSNGGPASPGHYKRYDYVQVLTPAQKQEAIEAGYPEDRLFFIPYGLNCQKFAQKLSQEEILTERRFRNLPIDRQVVLSVGAVNTSHKRMDWLIREFSNLDPEKFFLWIVGQPEEETKQIMDLAQNLLKPNSYKFDVIPYPDIPKVYACADYFVLCSLGEGFGRVYIEAMAAGLTVIAHRNMNTEWILGADNLGLVDMTKAQHLSNKICYFDLLQSESQNQAVSNQNTSLTRFEWSTLRKEYIEMYECVRNL